MSWKKMSIAIMLSAAFLLGGLMVVNYFVNPLGKYSSREFPSLVWTARADKAQLLSEFEQEPEVLVLGSSRSMKIDPGFIEQQTDKPSFNASVNSAMAEDYYVMLKYALEEVDVKPEAILLGIDVESFHNGRTADDRLVYNNRFLKYLHDKDRPNIGERVKTMLTYDEVAGSFRSLYFSATEYPEPMATYTENGFLHYPERERKLEKGTFEPKIKEYVEKYQGRYKGYTAVDADRQDYFEKFLQLAAENDIKVAGFITTLHDDVIKALDEDNVYSDRKKEVTAFLSEMEEKYSHFSYKDFDRVEKYDGSLEAFYDGAHIQEENANIITAELLSEVNLTEPARASASGSDRPS
ncbi:DUF1574 family protein [Bacillus marinisedimentorum]|uniref:DUF1574 family protein n=1 Tax=Bacillus marinisedimentorum TaxID=1821260 RepID=UPI0007E15850|nr:DUF1574 family protein [Bacillus marinisedimentorum]